MKVNFNPIYTPRTTSFKSLTREIKDENGYVVYRNNTSFFRGDVDWQNLVTELNKKYKDVSNPKIYCYACSDGSEPYSLALALINRLGKENAQKFFPIIAKDIDPLMIKNAKQGRISFFRSDQKKFMHQCPTLKFEDYFEFDELYNVAKINNNLRKCVRFEHGNLTKDIKKLNLENSTLMFRNVWPYLDDIQQKTLSAEIGKKAKDSTLVMVGHYDNDYSNAIHYLSKEGFHPQKTDYLFGLNPLPKSDILNKMCFSEYYTFMYRKIGRKDI